MTTSLGCALRNRATLAWLDAAARPAWKTTAFGHRAGCLPGTGNSLNDLRQGYASFLGCPTDEVDPTYPDADYLSWVYARFARQIEAHADTLL